MTTKRNRDRVLSQSSWDSDDLHSKPTSCPDSVSAQNMSGYTSPSCCLVPNFHVLTTLHVWPRSCFLQHETEGSGRIRPDLTVSAVDRS